MSRFRKPTVQELRAYAAELGYRDFDPDRFLDHYEACGWMVGRGKPMKCWRAAVRNWKRMDAEYRRDQVNAGAMRERNTAADRRRLARESRERYLAEALENLQAIRSWYGNEANCPFGDPEEEEQRLVAKLRDQHGKEFMRHVYQRLRAERKTGASR